MFLLVSYVLRVCMLGVWWYVERFNTNEFLSGKYACNRVGTDAATRRECASRFRHQTGFVSSTSWPLGCANIIIRSMCPRLVPVTRLCFTSVCFFNMALFLATLFESFGAPYGLFAARKVMFRGVTHSFPLDA